MVSYLNRLFNTPFFQNKFVLYGSLFVVLLSILRHLANRNINAVILMALIGLVMSYFSKNMIIVLLTAFASVFILEMVGSRGAMEGMKTKEGAENNGDDDDEKADADDEKADAAEKPAEKAKKAKKADKKENMNTEKGGKKKTKQGMTKLSPANYDGKEDEDDADSSGVPKGSSNRIDYAATLEQAYDNIEGIIGEDGVRGLTDQTKSLMNQQKLLMENMKDMGPLLKSAEGFMKQVTGGGGISGITEMLKGFATPGGKPAAPSASDKK
jgi:hypothetical protein